MGLRILLPQATALAIILSECAPQTIATGSVGSEAVRQRHSSAPSTAKQNDTLDDHLDAPIGIEADREYHGHDPRAHDHSRDYRKGHRGGGWGQQPQGGGSGIPDPGKTVLDDEDAADEAETMHGLGSSTSSAATIAHKIWGRFHNARGAPSGNSGTVHHTGRRLAKLGLVVLLVLTGAAAAVAALVALSARLLLPQAKKERPQKDDAPIAGGAARLLSSVQKEESVAAAATRAAALPCPATPALPSETVVKEDVPKKDGCRRRTPPPRPRSPRHSAEPPAVQQRASSLLRDTSPRLQSEAAPDVEAAGVSATVLAPVESSLPASRAAGATADGGLKAQVLGLSRLQVETC